MKDGEKLQIRNWIVEKVEMDGVDFMEVCTVNGDFRVMYRMDCKMFALLDTIKSNDKKSHEAMSVLFGNVYSVSSILDADFQHSVLMATAAYIDKVGVSDISEEESERIIEEERTAYEMVKENEQQESKEEKQND